MNFRTHTLDGLPARASAWGSVLGAVLALAACSDDPSTGVSSGSGGAGGGATTSSSATTATGTGGSGGATTGTGGSGTGGDASGGAGTGGDATGGAGTGGGGTGGAGGGAACVSNGTQCGDCAHAQCTDAYCACADNPECVALLNCANQCPDEQCRTTCGENHKDGISDVFLLNDCAAKNCQTDCPGADTGQPLDACGTCALQKCETEANECFADEDCRAILECLDVCADLPAVCYTTCTTGAPASGKQKVDAFFACAGTNCSGECGG